MSQTNAASQQRRRHPPGPVSPLDASSPSSSSRSHPSATPLPSQQQPQPVRSVGCSLLASALTFLLLAFLPLAFVTPPRGAHAASSSGQQDAQQFAAASRPASGLPALLGLSGRGFTPAEKMHYKSTVRSMFLHAYNAYMDHALPHDELKPLSQSWTDSLAELGNTRASAGSSYAGTAMSLVDSLSTLAVLGHKREFARAVDWVASHVRFEADVRVHVFETNIRMLGGLMSAHALALDPDLDLHETYDGALLPLAKDLGDRLLRAFSHWKPGGAEAGDVQLPYAWINLRSGVQPGETTEQCTAGVGTLLLEFGMLSHYTNDSRYYDAAERALFSLWALRNPTTQLLGNSFDCLTGAWWNTNSGIGAGIDSFHEYLLKSALVFGNAKFATMHATAAEAVARYCKFDREWYVEAEMASGTHTHLQFNSLAAFWPGLQTLTGELVDAAATHARHYGLWARFDALPERYLLQQHALHNSERHYILRPELMESTYFLYRATRHPQYLEMGARIIHAIERDMKVASGGYAGLRDVESKQKEDRQHSFFLAETIKYLYLLFDETNWVHSADMHNTPVQEQEPAAEGQCPTPSSEAEAAPSSSPQQRPPRSNGARLPNFVFTTEGHVFPVLREIHAKFGDLSSPPSTAPGSSSSAAAAPSTPAVGGSILIPSLLKSKYSLYASSSRMNPDTLRFSRALKSGELRRLGKAVCPLVPEHLKGGARDEKARWKEILHARAYATDFLRLASAFELRRRLAHFCPAPDLVEGSAQHPHFAKGHFHVSVGPGAFSIAHLPSGEVMDLRNLGTDSVEITNVLRLGPPPPPSLSQAPDALRATMGDHREILTRPVVLEASGKSFAMKLTSRPHSATAAAAAASDDARFASKCSREWDGLPALFGPAPSSAAAASRDLPGGAAATPHSLVAGLVVARPLDGCTAPPGFVDDGEMESSEYHGRLVLLMRGGCTFMEKVWRAQQMGARGVVVVNDVAAETNTDATAVPVNPLPLLMMGGDASFSAAGDREITIPSMMVPRAYGESIMGCLTAHSERELRRRALAESQGREYEERAFVVEMSKHYLEATSITHTTSSFAPAAASAAASSSATPSPSTSSSASLHPRVVGDLSKFFVTAMGGWTVEIEEKAGAFALKVY